MIFAWYRYCFKKYFSGGGRASRKEYWSFTLINAAIFILFWLISRVVDAPADPSAVGQADALPEDPVLSILFGTLYLIFILAILIPSFAVTMRRLHDRNHSALWILAQFIPVLNLVVLIMLLLPSSPRPNAYGLRAPRTPDDIVPNIAQNIYGVPTVKWYTLPTVTIHTNRHGKTLHKEHLWHSKTRAKFRPTVQTIVP